jgi:hypothetical protein
MSSNPNPPFGGTTHAPNPLTPPPAVKSAFELAYAKTLPAAAYDLSPTVPGEGAPVFSSTTAVLQFELQLQDDGTNIYVRVNQLTQAEQTQRYFALIAAGYGPELLGQIEQAAWSIWGSFLVSAQANEPWQPPAYLDGAPTIPIGAKGGVALPGIAPIPGWNSGPYPTTKPAGWLSNPTLAQMTALVQPGADVPAILETIWGGAA